MIKPFRKSNSATEKSKINNISFGDFEHKAYAIKVPFVIN